MRHRRRTAERRQLRLVLPDPPPHLREGRGSVLGGDSDRHTRWWAVTLDCGHRAELPARYTPDPRPVRARQRSRGDALPPPRRARCDQCPRTPRQEPLRD